VSAEFKRTLFWGCVVCFSAGYLIGRWLVS
jgi:hypothetical protein